MKLVQKTILATAVAVAFAPAAFADVTISGKAAAEIVAIQNDGGDKNKNGVDMVSDGLEIDFAGEYDIVGGNTAGFGIDTTLNKNTWGGESADSVDYDLAHVFIDTNFGKFSFGKLTQPSDDIKTDYWSNSTVAGTESRSYNTNGTVKKQGYYAGVGDDMPNTILYTNGNDAFDFGFSVSIVDKDKSSTHVERGTQLQYNAAIGVNVGPAKLELGVDHNPKRTSADSSVPNAKADTDIVLGADLENFTATITSTNDNDVLSVLLGAKHAFTDVVTGKATASVLNYEGTDANGKKEDKNNYKIALGADFKLAKNIVAHTVVDFKEVDGWKETQVDLATGVTVKF